MKATFFITADSLDKDKGAYPCVTKEQLKFAVQDRGLLHEDAKYNIPRIYVRLELGKEHLDRFSDYVNRYKKMSAELFVERWEYFRKH